MLIGAGNAQTDLCAESQVTRVACGLALPWIDASYKDADRLRRVENGS